MEWSIQDVRSAVSQRRTINMKGQFVRVVSSM